MKSVLAVVLGYAVWSVLWLAGSQVLQRVVPEVQPEMPITHMGALIALVVYSVLLSVLSGWVTAALAPRSATGHALVLALALLATGIMVQTSAWSLFPVWYHLLFLGLLVPATLYGAAVRQRRQAGVTA